MTLKLALICAVTGTVGCWSAPAILLASAYEYHVLGLAAFGKLLKMNVAPALPSTALVAVHVNAENCAWITIGTLLVSVAPQMLAA